MKVILLRDMKGVGKRFEEKQVGDGYAANFLIPKKIAVPATGSAAAQIKNIKEGEAKKRSVESEHIEAEVHKLSNTTISLNAKVNEQGHLFASINAEKLSELLKEQGTDLPAANIVLERPIKEAGEHQVPIKVGGKETHFTLSIKAK